MSESFLHYIWQFQYFDKKQLLTTQGEQVEIYAPGSLNTHAGPDFQNTRLKIGDMEWVGSTEIHLNASGWIDHHHEHDQAYQSVILHVVWKNDKPVKRPDGTIIPTIELKDRVDQELILSYKKLVNSPESIPCSGTFHTVRDLTRLSMMDRALTSRLESKAQYVLKLWERNNRDWEETCYQLLAKNFGFKVNADPFLQLAQAVPYKNLLKQTELLHIEALLFGQAGFLDEKASDEYSQKLQREYKLQKYKYNIGTKKLQVSQWRFLRLRPANFPTIRISQFAALIHSRKNIFSRILEAITKCEGQALFTVKQSPYWMHHYRMGIFQEESIAPLGKASIDNILINTVAPLLVAYGLNRDEQEWIDRAVDSLQAVSAEKNSIVRKWQEIGQPVTSAFDSQALIEIYNSLCLKRRCLDCHIGTYLINPACR